MTAIKLPDALVKATVAMCKQGLAEIEKGNFMPLEEFIAKHIEIREAERAARAEA
jgi:predicted transcriptional regulator